jgi:protein TonB
MTTEAIEPAEEKFDLVAVFRAAAPEARERKFWITLAIALFLHLAILIGIVRSPPASMGDPNSRPDAVSVSFVTEAELLDATTGADGGGATPAPQPTPPPPPQAQPQPPEPPTPPQPPEPQVLPQPAPPPAQQPKSEAEKAEPPPKSEELAKAEEEKAPESPVLRDSLPAEAVAEKKADEAERVKSDSEKETKETKEAQQPKETEAKETKEAKEAQQELAELLKLPDPATIQQPTPKQPSAKRQPQQQQQQKQAMRQPNMTMPPDAMTTPSLDGKSAGVQRPAGITRSGANDDFARGVVRALRQTMPQMNVLGRVTVRILINLNGNIQSVEVLSRSENTDLNRAIVFSTKQASFPFPPNGATELDRTFTITYIYH